MEVERESILENDNYPLSQSQHIHINHPTIGMCSTLLKTAAQVCIVYAKTNLQENSLMFS